MMFSYPASLERSHAIPSFLGHTLCRDIRSRLRKPEPSTIDSSVIDKLNSLAESATSGWESVVPILAAPHQSMSPFQALPLWKQTTKQFAVWGQNLHYWTQSYDSEDLKKEIFRLLRDHGSVRFFLQDSSSDGIKAWQKVFPEHFRLHLNKTIEKLRSWRDDMQNKELSGLEIKIFELIPITFTFSYPNLENGRMLITPVVPRAPKSGHRPVFEITVQEHKSILKD